MTSHYEQDSRIRTDWSEHYNEPSGKDKVDARQDLYIGCIPDGQKPINYTQEVIAVAGYLAIDKDATILDIGCSRPDLLDAVHKEGYYGLLLGVDPNSRQFGKMPYWKPRYDNHWDSYPHEDISVDTLLAYYDLQGDFDAEHQGIMLIEAIANRIPLPDNFVNLALQIFSLYHVDNTEHAMREISRLMDDGAYNLATLSRNNNKSWAHAGQNMIKEMLSEMKHEQVYGPEPLHSGFTVEDAELLFPRIFNHNKIKNISSKLIFDTQERTEILHAAHKSQQDQFKTADGKSVSEEDFEIAYEQTIGKLVINGIHKGRPMTDIASRAIIVSSGEGFDLPDEYEPIAGLSVYNG